VFKIVGQPSDWTASCGSVEGCWGPTKADAAEDRSQREQHDDDNGDDEGIMDFDNILID
jgi:hypothetical protein